MKIENIKVGMSVKVEGLRGSWLVHSVHPDEGVDEIAIESFFLNRDNGEIENQILVVSIEEIL